MRVNSTPVSLDYLKKYGAIDNTKRGVWVITRYMIAFFEMACYNIFYLFMEAMETMIALAKGDEATITRIKEKQLIGFEIDSVLFALACSNMFLHGDGRTNLLYRSSLLDETQAGIVNNSDKELLEYIRSMKPTRVIINPPYENNNPIKFTIQALNYLEPGGKLVIIMPTCTCQQKLDTKF